MHRSRSVNAPLKHISVHRTSLFARAMVALLPALMPSALLALPVKHNGPTVALRPAAVAHGRRSMQAAGFIGVRVDADRNKVLLEIPADKLNKDFLHQSVLATGLGGLGLDRGQLAGSVVVRLEKHGKRVLMIRNNWNVRAQGANAAETRAASEAFATSVMASFPIESENGGTIVADATTFLPLGHIRHCGDHTSRAAGHGAY